jgi:hypothetical protein
MLTFYRFMVWIVLRCRVYYVWSKLHRLLVDRQYRNTRLPMYDKLEHLETVIGRMVWRKDGWSSLWDAISLPRVVWAKHKMGMPTGDCDDHSIFAVSRLVNMARRGELVYLGVPPYGSDCQIGLLSCPWFDKDRRKPGGHNVAAFKYVDHADDKDKWAYMSNWYSGVIQWDFDSPEHIVKTVCGKKASLGWALADVHLKVQRYGRGSKIK